MRSLRARLLAWLLAPLLFMSGAHLASTWLDTRKTAEGIFDKLLVTLALSISEHALASGGDLLTEELLELIRITTNDHLYYKVIGPGGAFITGYEDLPEPAGGIGVAQNNLQFYDALYAGKAVRVIAVSSLIERPEYSGWMTTFVAQTKNERAAWVESILLQNLWRVALMIAIASGLLSVGVWLGLRPLARLQHAVHQRTSADLSPIPCRKLPREISALVSELNDLLARLQAHMQFTRRFVENAAHQLRTPVTALLPQAELAWRKAESARDKKAIGKIKTSAENLARLTHQLLNMARAESIALGGPPAAGRRDFSALDLADLAARRIAAFCELYPEIEVVADLQAARARGMAYELTRYAIDDLDRAIADSEDEGFVKVLTEPGRDRILGATIVSARAGDLLTEFTLAMRHNLGLNKILSTIHIYPTMSEANRFVAAEWRKARKPERLLRWVERYFRWRRGWRQG